MSVSDEDAKKFLTDGAVLAAKVASGMTGVVVGGVFAGLGGAVMGAALTPFLEHSLLRVVSEIAERRLSSRQRERAGASVLLLADAVKAREEAGETLRSDAFFSEEVGGRRPVDELLEHTIRSAIDAIEERRLPYLANLYASICFDETVSRASMATYAQLAGDLTYRRMCLIHIVGRERLYTGRGRIQGTQPEWPEQVHIIARDANGLVSDGILVLQREGDAGHDSNLAYLDIDPAMLRLGRIGQALHDRMGLFAISDTDDVVLDVQEALECIAASPSPGLVFDGGILS